VVGQNAKRSRSAVSHLPFYRRGTGRTCSRTSAAPCAVISRAPRNGRADTDEFLSIRTQVFYLKELGNSEMDEHSLWIAGFVLSRELNAIEMRDIYRELPRIASNRAKIQISINDAYPGMYDWVRPIKERKGVDVEWAINPAVHDGRFAETAELERSRRGTCGTPPPGGDSRERSKRG